MPIILTGLQVLIPAVLVAAGLGIFLATEDLSRVSYEQTTAGPALATSTALAATTSSPAPPAWPAVLDRVAYDQRLLALADYDPPPVGTSTATGSAAMVGYDPLPSQLVYSSSTNVLVPGRDWPAAAPYPHGGAILPFQRIVAYYGNFYSTRMGILGELPPAQVLAQLASTSAAWESADPDTPVLPAIHYIAMVAQGEAGADGMYRAMMPDEHIEQAYDMAQEIDGILFIDLQVGYSSLSVELPKFREFLTRPDVHLAIDPEFAMSPGNPPGTVIGSFSAAEINDAIQYLDAIVTEYELPPKVLVVHRFTQNMVGTPSAIEPTPNVQVVIHMDGWGSRELKRSTYRRVVEPDPVQFAGLKIFYKNDRKPPSTGIFSPAEALELHPEPIYIQYQ
ncbi:MAG: hypothetical protein ACOC4E_00420 [Patescibacteria group bacterium]